MSSLIRRSKQTRVVSKDNVCHLLMLPGELRNRIYHFSGLRSSTAICIGPAPNTGKDGNRATSNDPFPIRGVKEVTGLLCTNTQIYLEVRPLVFANNVFWFNSPFYTGRFIQAAGRDMFNLVEHLNLVAPRKRAVNELLTPMLNVLTESKNLRTVSFRFIDDNIIPEHPDEYQLHALENVVSFGSLVFKTALERATSPEPKNRLQLDLEFYSGLRLYYQMEVENYEQGDKDIGDMLEKHMALGMSPGKTADDFVALTFPYDEEVFFPDLHPDCVHDPWVTTVQNQKMRDDRINFACYLRMMQEADEQA